MRFFIPASLLILLALLTSATSQAQDSPANPASKLILLREGNLAAAKKRLAAGDPALKPAYTALLARAADALTTGPYSVMDKKEAPPSGDKHDFLSRGPYWWPNPATKTGLPYVRHDGRTNPESRDPNVNDYSRLAAMSDAARTLALAYYFTGEERYAAHAALLLRTWFLDPATRMNPHLNFGQGIPGITLGRGTGIIDTHPLIWVTDTATLLRPSKSWPVADHEALAAWFGKYMDWMLTSKIGQEEGAATNNHGTWYDAQVITFAVFAGRLDVARRIAEAAREKRIAHEIEPDGKMPEELARTKSYHYCIFNLTAFFNMATAADRVGVGLFNFNTPDNRGFRAALAYLMQFTDPSKKWGYQEISGAAPDALIPLLVRAAAAYDDPAYLKTAQKISAKKTKIDEGTLLWAK